MTEETLAEIERLWHGRLHIEDIARRVGYSKSAVSGVINSNRERFPRRKVKVPQDKRELWVERVKAGRVTDVEAAKALGVHIVTFRRWLKTDEVVD